MARNRGRIRNILSHLPLNGCIIFFHASQSEVRGACSGMGGLVEAHKINGEFLNHDKQTDICDMYVCMKGNLDEFS